MDVTGWKKIPITKCGFSKRLVNSFEKCGVKTLGEAANLGIWKLLRQPNCGRASVIQLETVLRFIEAQDQSKHPQK